MVNISKQNLFVCGLLAVAIALPLFVSAQGFTISKLFLRASEILSMTLGLLIGVAFAVFIWGVIQYVIAQGDENKLKEGKQVMIYGIIGLTIIISIWGITELIVFTVFGETAIGNPFDFKIPKIP